MSFADLDSLPKDPALAVERLSQQLRQWSASYYRGDHGSIPDALYDRWFERLLELDLHFIGIDHRCVAGNLLHQAADHSAQLVCA